MEELKEIAARLIDTANLLKNVEIIAPPENTPKSEFLTVQQTAEFLNVKKATIYKMIQKREIPYYKPNGRILYFAIDDLKKWQSSNRQPSKNEIESELAKNV